MSTAVVSLPRHRTRAPGWIGIALALLACVFIASAVVRLSADRPLVREPGRGPVATHPAAQRRDFHEGIVRVTRLAVTGAGGEDARPMGGTGR